MEREKCEREKREKEGMDSQRVYMRECASQKSYNSLSHQPLKKELKKVCATFFAEDPHKNGNCGRIVGDKQMKRIVKMLETHGGKVERE